MPAPELSFVKPWCSIDGDAFDSVLPTMIASATALASHETGVDYTVEVMPEAVQQWVAANVGFWIDNKNAGSDKKLEPSPFLAGLLDPYRLYDWSPA